MIEKNFKRKFSKNLTNIPGWRTKRKLVIFESDDWGSIRMPSNMVYQDLVNHSIDLSSDEGYLFNKYDSLATNEDLASLFEVLSSGFDSQNKQAVITPISVVANPDFNKISKSGFNQYYYEPFPETIKKYPGCEKSYELWLEGIEKKLFVPEFHGREHLNVLVWMRALQKKHNETIIAFDNEMWGISTKSDESINLEFQAAFDFYDPDDLEYHKEIIATGLDLFEKLFGFRAKYFVPPNGPFSSKLESACLSGGIRFLCVPKIKSEPIGWGKTKKKLYWIGKKNRNGLTYITRNCLFEPVRPGIDWVDRCMYDISVAFKWGKPAIISTHRVNYIGALYKNNRDNGLKNLSLLLKKIVNKWPNVEFITSAELGEIILDEK